MPRMNLRTLALGAVLAIAAPGMAQSQEVAEYQGQVFITDADQTCVDLGYPVGSFFAFALRPKVRPSNNDGGGLMLRSPTLTWVYRLPDGTDLGTGNAKGTFGGVGISSHVGVFEFASKFKLKIAVSGTTATISGSIGTFNGEDGCEAEIQGAGTLRIYGE